MDDKLDTFKAEICAEIDGEQYPIWIGPFTEKKSDDDTLKAADLMGLCPVRKCTPIWRRSKYKIM